MFFSSRPTFDLTSNIVIEICTKNQKKKVVSEEKIKIWKINNKIGSCHFGKVDWTIKSLQIDNLWYKMMLIASCQERSNLTLL